MNEDSRRIAVSVRTRRGFGTSTVDAEDELGVGWFAVELVAGRTYAFALAQPLDGRPAREAPMLGIYSRAGALVADTRGRDFAGRFARKITLKPRETGTYYLAAKGIDHETLAVWDASPRARSSLPADEDPEHDGAACPRDEPIRSGGDLHGTRRALHHCRLGPDVPGGAGFGLSRHETNGAPIIEDADGNTLVADRNRGLATEWCRFTLLPGNCYVGIEPHAAGSGAYSSP